MTVITSRSLAEQGLRGSRLEHMRLKNFRSFVDTGRVSFAPLTLLFGKNSSGKTSLLRTPLLLRQLAIRTSVTAELPLSGPDVDFGSYRDLVRGRDVRRDIEVSFGLSSGNGYLPSRIRRSEELIPLLSSPEVTIGLHWNKRSGQAQIQWMDFAAADSRRYAIRLVRKGPHAIGVDAPILDFAASVTDAPPLNLSSLDFIRLTGGEARDATSEAIQLALWSLSESIDTATARVIHIPPLRDMPERAYRLDVAATGTISSRTIAIMAQQGDATRQAGAWMRKLGIAEDVSLSKVAPGWANILLTVPESRLKVNLADVGFGASQVLPILVLLASVRPGSTVLIEHPELHLHPRAVAELGDVLIDAATNRGLGLVIETHSEHLFLRIRRRLAEGSLKAGDVEAYVVDAGRVRPIGVDARGQIDVRALPDGFFEEEWDEAAELAKAMARRSGS